MPNLGRGPKVVLLGFYQVGKRWVDVEELVEPFDMAYLSTGTFAGRKFCRVDEVGDSSRYQSGSSGLLG